VPILVAAFLPLFVTSPDSRFVAITVGVGSWLVFIVDLVVQRRIVPDYLQRSNGRIDLAIVILTFPFYLLPGAQFSGLLLLARLGRVVRVLMATAGLRRFAARLGKVAVVAGVSVIVGAMAAYEAENSTNPAFASVGDALWWGCVTLTTVGYGDITPVTTAGRFAGVALMFTGVAVLGVLAGSLASLFGLDPNASSPSTDPDTAPASGSAPGSMADELGALRTQLQAVERRMADLADRANGEAAGPG
jgi:voltage-gated potassium channel